MKSIGYWVNHCEQALRAGGVVFGHGTDNARDESAWLVLHVTGRPLDGSYTAWDDPVPDEEARRIEGLLERRLNERKPMAYLLGEAWFCGLRFLVNENVLVPRSPLAELIARQFHPWARPERLQRALDLCTGSGCIGIAVAHSLPNVRVDAVDISESALALAAENVALHGLGDRVRLVRSNLFESLAGCRYDLIVSNPPYVSDLEIESFPAEYLWEPRLGFHAAEEGLKIVLDILRKAPAYLEDGGVLVCEVGEAADRLQARLPAMPLTWLEFEHGGGGVFTIDREALVRSLEDQTWPGRDT